MDSHAPAASYPVRTAPSYYVGIALAVLVGLVPVVMFTWLGTPPSDYTFIWLAYLTFFAVPVVVVINARPYRVVGGRGQVRVFRDRLELPGAIRLPLAGLQVGEKRHVTRFVMIGFIPVGEMEAERLLVLRSERGKHVLPGRIFEHPDAYDALRRDLGLARQGKAPEGVEGLERARAPRVADHPKIAELEAQLDRELAELD